MSETKNECEIVNRLSRKVEKELAENMDEINTRLDNVAEIDDTVSSLTTTYSSDKIDDLIENIPGADVIDDAVTTTTKTWSSSKIVDLLFSVLSGESKYIAINTTISRVTGVYTTVLTITDLNLSATSKGVLNLNFSVTAGSSHPGKELLITGIKSDSTTYVINDTLIPRSETSTQSYTLNLPNVVFENNTTEVKIEIKNSTNDQYSATFNFTGYLNTLAI